MWCHSPPSAPSMHVFLYICTAGGPLLIPSKYWSETTETNTGNFIKWPPFLFILTLYTLRCPQFEVSVTHSITFRFFEKILYKVELCLADFSSIIVALCEMYMFSSRSRVNSGGKVRLDYDKQFLNGKPHLINYANIYTTFTIF